ncbi:hypothetical protein [Flavobacterium sp. MK4S-17]|uniref:hypothetical protein n=1 Tax=Flavobacterium sp. MK4S-17 TaxID=2543737 RepID=UPI0013569409|nr:hypothetical protein [Flavobacterium sp. MK4S-17]
MINDIIYTPPLIDFGFGITEQTITAGEAVTVWLSSLYNQNSYTFHLIAPEGDIKVLSNYQYKLYYQNKGTYNIQLHVKHAVNTNIILKSNILNLTVME